MLLNMSGSMSLFGFNDELASINARLSALENSGTNLPLAVKGDLITRSSTTNVRLGVGINGQILAADSTTATGLKYTNTVTDPTISGTLTMPTITTNASTTPLVRDGTTGLIYAGVNFATATNTLPLSNKSLITNSTSIVDVADATKTLLFQTMDSTTGVSTTVRTFSSTNRIITLPNATTTLLGDNNTTAMSNKTIDSGLNTLTITNSPLSAANVNTLLNQALLTTSSPTFVAVTLQTTGGTPTALNYYEEGSFNLTFTGPFTTTVSCNFVRVGKAVNFNMSWSTLAASAGGFFTTSGLPARLTPAIAVDCQIWVADSGAWLTTPGRIVVGGTTISIYKTNQTGTFTASSTAGFGNWSWTWRV